MSPAEKIEDLLGMSADGPAAILCWPPLLLDQLRLLLSFQLWRIVWKIGMKAMRDGTPEREIARERDRQRIVEAQQGS